MNPHGGVAFDGTWYYDIYIPEDPDFDYYDLVTNIVSEVMIAPFWSGISYECGSGSLYFRHTTDTSILNKAASDIQQHFPISDPFAPLSAVVVTWDRVFDSNCDPYVS